MARAHLEFHPATAGRWSDLARLFGPRGACAGCWCMWPRLARAEFRAGMGARNRRALKRIVAAGETPGILAYVDGEPAGWCAVGPRPTYRRLENSKSLAPVDDRPVWSVVCFFVARPHRRQGLSVRLLREAVRHAAARGARIVEGYPTDSEARIADAWVWTGVAAAFERAGFREVARRARTRPIMRRVIRATPRAARATPHSAARGAGRNGRARARPAAKAVARG
ncbi:MAG TPA: GNAT family N-acetyltransferase [Candidatus Eisenbacteria bacterium]|jgi:GNAT superfamily N-acetyltransferase